MLSAVLDRAWGSCSLTMSCKQALLEERNKTEAAVVRADEQTTLCSSLQQSLQVPAHPCPRPLHLPMSALFHAFGASGQSSCIVAAAAGCIYCVCICMRSRSCTLCHGNHNTPPSLLCAVYQMHTRVCWVCFGRDILTRGLQVAPIPVYSDIYLFMWYMVSRSASTTAYKCIKHVMVLLSGFCSLYSCDSTMSCIKTDFMYGWQVSNHLSDPAPLHTYYHSGSSVCKGV